MFGFSKPSLTLRIALGKLLGLVIGIAGIIMLPEYAPDAGFTFKIAVLFWYVTIGAVIGLMGVYIRAPVVNIKLSWWWRGAIVGAWFNFLLLMFTFDIISKYVMENFGDGSFFGSPWWIVAEGAIVGFVMDWILTKFAGEGPELVEELVKKQTD